jgi:hypothetical protein
VSIDPDGARKAPGGHNVIHPSPRTATEHRLEHPETAQHTGVHRPLTSGERKRAKDDQRAPPHVQVPLGPSPVGDIHATEAERAPRHRDPRKMLRLPVNRLKEILIDS